MEEIGIEDISKMKVAELKKQLRMKGLAVTGNKTELIDRLQEAFETDGMAGIDSTASIDEEEEDFDEEEILGEGEDDELSKISPQEEDAVLGSASIHVKKTPIVKDKKISLKRSEPCLSTPIELFCTSEETKVEKDSAENKENTEGEEPTEPKHKVIKLSEKDLATPEDRAIKFGISTATKTDPKSARAARFGTNDSKTTNSKPGKLSMETGGTDLEKLKKRAERFGEVTSKSLSTLEVSEKLKKRENRFGKPATDIAKADDVKTIIKVNSDDKIATASETNGSATKVVDAKSKRAQRFGL